MKFFISFLVALNAYGATTIEDCGLYDIYGQFRKNEKTRSYEFLVNAGSISQYTFEINDQQERMIVPYIGHSLKLRAKILQLAPEYVGKFNNIEKIDFSVPDPANIKRIGGFDLVNKEKCK